MHCAPCTHSLLKDQVSECYFGGSAVIVAYLNILFCCLVFLTSQSMKFHVHLYIQNQYQLLLHSARLNNPGLTRIAGNLPYFFSSPLPFSRSCTSFSLGHNCTKYLQISWLMNSEYDIYIHISNIYSLLPSDLLQSSVISPQWDRSGWYSAWLDLNADGPRNFWLIRRADLVVIYLGKPLTILTVF